MKKKRSEWLNEFLEFASSNGVNENTLLDAEDHLKLNSKESVEKSKNKFMTKEILLENGLSVAKGFLARQWEEVLQEIDSKQVDFPLVAKPNNSSKGAMVFANIVDLKDLKTAFERIKKEYDEVLLEEYVEGSDYRFFVLDGKVLAVAKRTLPFVNGDGKTRIRDLIPKKVLLDWEVERNLKDQDLDLDSVPEEGIEIVLRGNSNMSTGGMVENVTGKINTRFSDIAESVAKILDLRLVGVDMIIKDASNSNSSYCVLETNAAPGFKIHKSPDIGESIDLMPFVLQAFK